MKSLPLMTVRNLLDEIETEHEIITEHVESLTELLAELGSRIDHLVPNVSNLSVSDKLKVSYSLLTLIKKANS